MSGVIQDLVQVTDAPRSMQEVGVSKDVLMQLLLKQLHVFNGLTLAQAVDKLKLSGTITEALLAELRSRALVFATGSTDGQQPVTFSVTDLGRLEAESQLARNSYTGPAPISLTAYRNLVARQSVRNARVTQDDLERCFAGMVLEQDIKDRLGPAVVSGKSLFLYGPAGTGKTFVAQKINELFRDDCLIPYAIEIHGQVLPVFDPILHRPINPAPQVSLRINNRQDQRLIQCRRPRIVVGGEMTVAMLDVQFDPHRKSYVAPLQLRANNGVFIIDDMGRQKSTPEEIFNRWIIPMEEKQDYLTIGSGQHFSVPFDQLLVFSSNINPRELADEAFLRRIGYKILISHISEQAYRAIWKEECQRLGLDCVDVVLDFVLNDLHQAKAVALLPCHPRDLLEMTNDRIQYQALERTVTIDQIRWAWENYFVSLDTGSKK